MRPLIALLALTVVLLGACDNAERCSSIQMAEIGSSIMSKEEARFLTKLYALPGYDAMSDSRKRLNRRSLRAQAAAEFRRLSDSTDRLNGYDRPSPDSVRYTPASDSADPKPSPPPRPSDLVWYGEHCYEGKPR